MRAAIRTFLAVAVLAWLIAALPATMVRGQGGPSALDHPGPTSVPASPGDECLVEIHDGSGPLPDGGTLCQTATDRLCTFNLQLCLNQPEAGCTPANFTKHSFHATGHCGPVRQLRVNSMGTDSVCGAFTGVDVRTRSNGKRPGKCTIRAEVRSAKVGARTDVDTVTLACMPRGSACPSTTTTTTPGATTTSTVAGATTTTTTATTLGATTTTTLGPTTTTTLGATTTTTTLGATTSTLASTTTTTAPATTSTTSVATTTTTMLVTTTTPPTTTTTMAACNAIVPGQPIANTYHTQDIVGPGVCILGSATNELGACQSDADCGGTGGACIPTPWISAGGITLPFPLGINLTYTVTSEDPAPSCSHPTCLGCGNAAAVCSGMAGCGGNPPTNPKCVSSTCCDQPALTVPTFFLSSLGTCVKVDQKTCGLGVVNSSNPQTGDNEVSKTGDTSDPGPDCIYGTADDPAPKPCDTSVGGAGSDKAGKVVRTLGNGMPDAAGIHSRFAVPIMATAWTDKPPQTTGAACPGNDTFDVGEILLTQLILNAELTTAGATGSFADLNGDGCAFAGSAFGGGNVGPIVLAPPTVHPAPYAGGANLMASVGLVFPGTGPLNDLGFIALVPFAQPAVAPSQSCSCTLTPGCPE